MNGKPTAWPYHAAELRHTFVPDQIEQQGLEILLRSINNGRLLAFVGSGVSMEVGRPSWAQLAAKICKAADSVKPKSARSTKTALALKSALKTCYEATSNNPLVYLELCDELFKLAGEVSVRERIVEEFASNTNVKLRLTNSEVAELFPLDSVAQSSLIRSLRRWTADKKNLADTTNVRLLVRTLAVRRFATTNYDTQVEEELKDLGWEQKDLGGLRIASNATSSLAVSASHRSACLTPDSLGYAFTFAFEGRRKHASVLHLHGSHLDKDAIVATETDYQRQYLRSSPRRDLIDAAIGLLFGANPILYVGCGLTEDDVIRPLRQIMSSAGQQDDALGVALLPAASSRQDLDRRAIELFARYGVHTIYYDLPGASRGTPWLHQLKVGTDGLKKLLRLTSPGKTEPIYLPCIRDDQLGNDQDSALIRSALDLLQRIAEGASERATAPGADTPAHLLRLVEAAETSITSSCLHFQLLGVGHRRLDWARELTEPFQHLERVVDPSGATLSNPYRHVGVISAGANGSPPSDRWNALIKNLEGHERFVGGMLKVRRMILIATPRGSGKGSMFDELSDHEALRVRLCRTLSGKEGNRSYRVGLFSMMFLVDITDVIQAVEQLVSLLIPESSSDSLLMSDEDPLRRSVLGQLERSLTRLGELAKKRKTEERLLIVISNAGGLFHRDGDAKNGQVLRAANLLLSPRFKHVPIDFVVFCDDQHVPKWFRYVGETGVHKERSQLPSLVPKFPNQIEAQARLRILGIRPLDLKSRTTHVFVPGRCKAKEIAAQFPHLAEFAGDEQEEHVLFRELYLALGRNRIALTLVMAQAEELVRIASKGLQLATFEEYVGGVASELATQIQEGFPDIAIQFVLDKWDIMHRRWARSSSDQWLRHVVANIAGGLEVGRVSAEHWWPLMVELLWHLSVVSHPVEYEVLAECPGVKAQAGLAELDDTQRVEAVRFALELCVERRLAFRVLPRMGWPMDPSEKRNVAEGIAERVRYTVHRAVQRHFVRAMGGRNVDSTEWDQFTTSLYASQRDDLPSISIGVHKRLMILIDELIGLSGGALHDPDDRDSKSSWVVSAKLRAAYFIARSTYSLGVLSHIAQTTGDAEGPYFSGLMEEYRRRVRWITHRASELQFKARADRSLQRAAKPFLAGEVVWLHAECGAVSLTQGKLEDADALLQMALRAVRKIETDEQGSMHVRILLHLAMTHIERGRPTEARRLLEPIAKRTGGHRVPPLLALCYLGLIDHLGGDYGHARSRYETARRGLSALGRNRAEALVTKHLADLEFATSNGDATQAVSLARDAMSIAQRGGHEDVRMLAVLTYVRLRSSVSGTSGAADNFALLDLAQNYSRRMGIPRIECVTRELRARLLFAQGETSMSMQEATASMRIAAMYELKLMKAKGMLTLAEICWLRKEHKLAADLARDGSELANATEYFSCVRGFRDLEVRIASSGVHCA